MRQESDIVETHTFWAKDMALSLDVVERNRPKDFSPYVFINVSRDLVREAQVIASYLVYQIIETEYENDEKRYIDDVNSKKIPGFKVTVLLGEGTILEIIYIGK